MTYKRFMRSVNAYEKTEILDVFNCSNCKDTKIMSFQLHNTSTEVSKVIVYWLTPEAALSSQVHKIEAAATIDIANKQILPQQTGIELAITGGHLNIIVVWRFEVGAAYINQPPSWEQLLNDTCEPKTGELSPIPKRSEIQSPVLKGENLDAEIISPIIKSIKTPGGSYVDQKSHQNGQNNMDSIDSANSATSGAPDMSYNKKHDMTGEAESRNWVNMTQTHLHKPIRRHMLAQLKYGRHHPEIQVIEEQIKSTGWGSTTQMVADGTRLLTNLARKQLFLNLQKTTQDRAAHESMNGAKEIEKSATSKINHSIKVASKMTFKHEPMRAAVLKSLSETKGKLTKGLQEFPVVVHDLAEVILRLTWNQPNIKDLKESTHKITAELRDLQQEQMSLISKCKELTDIGSLKTVASELQAISFRPIEKHDRQLEEALKLYTKKQITHIAKAIESLGSEKLGLVGNLDLEPEFEECIKKINEAHTDKLSPITSKIKKRCEALKTFINFCSRPSQNLLSSQQKTSYLKTIETATLPLHPREPHKYLLASMSSIYLIQEGIINKFITKAKEQVPSDDVEIDSQNNSATTEKTHKAIERFADLILPARFRDANTSPWLDKQNVSTKSLYKLGLSHMRHRIFYALTSNYEGEELDLDNPINLLADKLANNLGPEVISGSSYPVSNHYKQMEADVVNDIQKKQKADTKQLILEAFTYTDYIGPGSQTITCFTRHSRLVLEMAVAGEKDIYKSPKLMEPMRAACHHELKGAAKIILEGATTAGDWPATIFSSLLEKTDQISKTTYPRQSAICNDILEGLRPIYELALGKVGSQSNEPAKTTHDLEELNKKYKDENAMLIKKSENRAKINDLLNILASELSAAYPRPDNSKGLEGVIQLHTFEQINSIANKIRKMPDNMDRQTKSLPQFAASLAASKRRGFDELVGKLNEIKEGATKATVKTASIASKNEPELTTHAIHMVVIKLKQQRALPIGAFQEYADEVLNSVINKLKQATTLDDLANHAPYLDAGKYELDFLAANNKINHIPISGQALKLEGTSQREITQIKEVCTTRQKGICSTLKITEIIVQSCLLHTEKIEEKHQDRISNLITAQRQAVEGYETHIDLLKKENKQLQHPQMSSKESGQMSKKVTNAILEQIQTQFSAQLIGQACSEPPANREYYERLSKAIRQTEIPKDSDQKNKIMMFMHNIFQNLNKNRR